MKYILLFSLILFSSFPAFAEKKDPAFKQRDNNAIVKTYSKNITTQINSVLKQYEKNIDIGIVVRAPKQEKNLYSQNADRTFTPASTLKLFIAAATLKQLGKDFTFQTSLHFDPKKISHHVLHDNLYITFSGDPTLTQKDIKALLKALHHYEIKQIDGNIILDTSIFEASHIQPGVVWDDLNMCYAAPISATNLDHNCFRFTLFSGKKHGDETRLTHHDGLTFTPVINTVVTSTTDPCELNLTANTFNQYTLSGCMKKQTHVLYFHPAIKNPEYYTTRVIETFLSNNDITFNGAILTGNTPKTLPALATHASKPLSTLLVHMIVHSDNLYANTLLKTLGAQYYHTSGTWENGVSALETILTKAYALDFSQSHMIDGAGLSRYNKITPQLLADLLSHVYQDNTLNGTLVGALPKITMKDGIKHFVPSFSQHWMRIKTGTMQDIDCLAGYVITKNNQVLIVTIMINNVVGSAKQYRDLENQIATTLMDVSV